MVGVGVTVGILDGRIQYLGTLLRMIVTAMVGDLMAYGTGARIPDLSLRHTIHTARRPTA